MSAVNYYAIIVGGGSGSRMESHIPKQFILLNKRPVLMHTIEAFYASRFAPEIILVLPVDFHEYWKVLCVEHDFKIPHKIISGGEQRFHSVKNGLQHVNPEGIVAIHDAVRPCVSLRLIDSAYKQASDSGTAIAAVKSRDSVRMQTQEGTVSLERDNIYMVQTPQVFRTEIITSAYNNDYRKEFTDDATVVESGGGSVSLIEGDRHNIKITYPEDILVAETFLSSKK